MICGVMLSRLHCLCGGRSVNLSIRRNFNQSAKQKNTPLEKPEVLYSDNHLLVVNKPVGWHSVPNPSPSPKCLLSELKRLELGGGSRKDFLLPLHRIDQPCSGVMLLGKTSKAATRITTLWKQKKVDKEYLCVVSASGVDRLEAASTASSDGWFCLEGRMERRPSKENRSAMIRPLSHESDARVLSIGWRFVPVDTYNEYRLLLVRTSDGARHMVRALLGQVGACPIAGDLRYNAMENLEDQSVALHAFRVSLDKRLKLGSLDTFDFQAPIPLTWKNFFSIERKSVVHC